MRWARSWVLDICCGPGNFANHLGLAYPDIQVTGIDLNETFLHSSRKRFGPYGWQFDKEDARAYNLGRTYDFVEVRSAYHHTEHEDRSK